MNIDKFNPDINDKYNDLLTNRKRKFSVLDESYYQPIIFDNQPKNSNDLNIKIDKPDIKKIMADYDKLVASRNFKN